MKDRLTCETYARDMERILDTLDLKALHGSSVLVTGGLGLICSAVVDLLIAYY